MKVAAPAKVNLTLHILGKRPDGFHEIETLMAPLALADQLEIGLEGGRDGRIDFACSDPSIPADPTNLVVRAAQAFCSRTGRRDNLRIRLEKIVPHGAGLGGGSSDAAATLLALDHLLETSLPDAALAELAAELGSDVAFFLRRGAALCTGRGERVGEPVLEIPAWPILLLKPPFGVPTPWAYKAHASLRAGGQPAGGARPVVMDGIPLANDLELPVFKKFLMLADMKAWLARQPGVRAAMMSGSGSTVFAVLEEEADAEGLAGRARDRHGPTLWTCATRLTP